MINDILVTKSQHLASQISQVFFYCLHLCLKYILIGSYINEDFLFNVNKQ